MDVGERAVLHHSVLVHTSASDFLNWVEVAASDDCHQWSIVNERAPISRFRKENLDGNQTVRYSENNARYLRVRIQEFAHTFEVTGMEDFSSPAIMTETPSEKGELLTAMLLPDSSGESIQPQWTVELGAAAIPIASF